MSNKPTPTLIERALADLNSPPSECLTIGGLEAEELAQRFGTPTYVYDANVLRRRFADVKQSMGVNVLYALKANPSLAVAHVLREAGAGAEIASAGEMYIAEKAGFSGEQMQFAGPGKSEQELRLAVDKGLYSINMESEAEYEAIVEVAKTSKRKPQVSIRVNPPKSSSGARMHMGGGAKKFGVDASEVAALLRRIQSEGKVQLQGLHNYLGTQCFSAEAWLQGASQMLAFTKEMEAEANVALPSIDFGGGFGVPCFERDKEFDLAAAGRGLRTLLEGEERHAHIELGRYLTAPAGVYLTRVRYIKESGGKRFAVLDGGIHHHSAGASVGSVVPRPFPMVAAKAPLSQNVRPQTLCGPLCTPVDVFATGVELPELEVGDLVAILISGAYGLTFSNVLFLSHPTPGEVLVDGGRAHLIREPGRPQDALRGQHLPGQYAPGEK